MQQKLLTLAALSPFLLAAVPLAATAALPPAVAPPGFVVKDVPAGGRIVYGRPASPQGDALRAGLRIANRYFGGTLGVDAIVHDARGAAPAQTAVFHASLGGTPVAGLAVAAVDPRGGPRLALLFDRDDRVARTLPAMYEELSSASTSAAHGRTASGALAAVPPLHTVTANDQSIAVKIPDGWKVRFMEHGMFSVAGPDGARVDYAPLTVVPPAGARYMPGALQAAYVADPASAFVVVRRAMASQRNEPDPNVRIERSTPLTVPSFASPGTRSSIVVATVDTPEGKRRVGGYVTTLPPSQPIGPWQLNLVGFCSAPADRFRSDLPTMLAMVRSIALNGKVLADQNRRISEGITTATEGIVASAGAFRERQRGVFEASMASARQAQDGIDRSTAGFVHYLSDRSVVESASTGTHGTFGDSLARALVNASPNEFSIVPLNRYRKGVDY
jgi:hypothetical protein